MPRDTFRPWLRAALPAAAAYVLIGLGTVAASRAAGGAGMPAVVRILRAGSWLVSGVVFLLHLRWEGLAGRKAAASAWHASAAVTLATLVLALVATVRQVRAGNTRPAVLVALVVWPVLTGVVSFAVGLGLSLLLRAVSRERSRPAGTS